MTSERQMRELIDSLTGRAAAVAECAGKLKGIGNSIAAGGMEHAAGTARTVSAQLSDILTGLREDLAEAREIHSAMEDDDDKENNDDGD